MRLRIMLPLVLVLLSLVVAGCFQSSKPKYGDVTGVIYVKEGANRAGIDVSLAGK